MKETAASLPKSLLDIPPFKFENPITLIKRKEAGKRSLGIDMTRVKEYGSRMTMDRFVSGSEEGVPETKTIYDWIEFLAKADFDYDEDNNWMLLKDGTRYEPTDRTEWAVRSLFDAFTKIWKACRKPLSHANFFYLERDEVVDSPDESWDFFIGIENKIIVDHFSVMNPMYQKHPTIWDFFFDPVEHTSWGLIDRDQAAYTEWMYRKFFTETEQGQILAIAWGLAPGRPLKRPGSFLKENWVIFLIGAAIALFFLRR